MSFACLSLSLCIDSVNELKNKNFLESIFPIATLSIATGLMRAFDEEMQDYILYAITLIALLDAISL